MLSHGGNDIPNIFSCRSHDKFAKEISRKADNSSHLKYLFHEIKQYTSK